MSIEIIKIYVEGANQDTRSDMENAFNSVLQSIITAARAKNIKIQFVAGYGRPDCYKYFLNEYNDKKRDPNKKIVLLLLDSEKKHDLKVSAKDHLFQQDHFKNIFDKNIDEEKFYLMTTSMESWIIASPDSIIRYLVKQDTDDAKLTNVKNHIDNFIDQSTVTDDFSKAEIEKLFDQICQDTLGRNYRKADHGFEFLKYIDATTALQKSESFKRFYNGLNNLVAR